MNETPFIIIRGAPGAGKSTFAKKIQEKMGKALIFETDEFFVDQVDKKYHFNAKLLSIAHSWNQGNVIRACRDYPEVPIIVANTMCQTWEVEQYLKIARDAGRLIYVFTLRTDHPNVHGVPYDKVVKMATGLQDFRMSEFSQKYPIIYVRQFLCDDMMDVIAQRFGDKYDFLKEALTV